MKAPAKTQGATYVINSDVTNCFDIDFADQPKL